jgi:hypothetical protein
MPVGLRSLANFYDILRYSLNPFERMLYPFKKYRFNDFRKKCLNENGIIETLEDHVSDHYAIPVGYTSNAEN